MLDIIIPAYNAHDTITKTLLSVALQVVRDEICVCIVDDCSKEDYSSEIALFSDKIKIKQIVLNKNVGPGMVRQKGIEETNSEYIMFLDSDDVLVNCYSIRSMINVLKKDKYDMICGCMIAETSEGEVYLYNNHQGCLHGKLYSRSFIEKNKIYFNNAYTNEDNSFNQLFLMYDPKIYYLDNDIYLYRNNVNSITKKSGNKFLLYDLESYINNMLWVLDEGEKRRCKQKNIANLMYSSLFYIYLSYIRNFDDKNKSLIIKWARPLLKYYKKYSNVISDEEIQEIYKEYYYGEIIPISFNDFFSILTNRRKVIL